MSQPSFTITPISERAVVISFGNVIDIEVHSIIWALHLQISNHNFDGFTESVPAYSSLAVFYEPNIVLQNQPKGTLVFDWVSSFIKKSLEFRSTDQKSSSRLIEVPVIYDGPDLKDISNQKKIKIEDVIQLHSSKEYMVFMMGFLPGFAYMGLLDPLIATPRRSSPRTNVPAGSVGIAGNQTGIYPQSSPGGWQLIGRTPLKIFDASNESPCLFQPGDIVKFYSIDTIEFEKINEH